MTSADKPGVRVAVIVLGMHRSGTSAMAGVLSHLGCDLPENLMPPTEANPKGYFESVKAYKLNDALLASGGSSWNEPTAFAPDWYSSPKYFEFRERASSMLREEFGTSRLFVLKDPRICRLVPFWRDVLAAQGAEPRYVCIHRHPREVAASLSRREGWSETTGVLLWLRHVLDAELSSRGAPRVFVSYDALMSDWRTLVRKIGDGLDLSWPVPVESASIRVEAFLSGELRHFRAASQAVPKQSASFAWVTAAYDILERWAADGEQAEDHARLDALKAKLEEVSPFFRSLVREGGALRIKVAGLEAQLTATRAESIALATNQIAARQGPGKATAHPADAGAAPETPSRPGAAAGQVPAGPRANVLAVPEELARLRDEKRAESARIAQLQKQLDGERGRVAAFHRRVAELEDAQAQAARRRRNVEEAHSRLKAAYLLRGQKLEALRVETAAKSETIRAMREQEKRHLERSAAELETFRQAISSSTSWRVTAPLRAVVGLFRRGRQPH